MVVIGIVLLVIIVVVTVVGSWYLKRKVGSRTRSQPRSNRFETEMSELDLPVNLLNVIGRGRFGCVYRAEYNDEVVAVKMFNYHNRQSWENEREVYSMESTPHQNILEYIGSESRGSRYDVQLCTITRCAYVTNALRICVCLPHTCFAHSPRPDQINLLLLGFASRILGNRENFIFKVIGRHVKPGDELLCAYTVPHAQISALLTQSGV